MFERLPSDGTTKKLLRSPSTFYELTRMTINEFLVRYDELEGTLSRATDNLLIRGAEIGENKLSVRTKIHPADSLLAWMMRSDGADSLLLAL